MAKKSTKIAELRSILQENNVTSETIDLNDEIIAAMKKNAMLIQDYRHESYVRHLMVDIIMITFFAMLSNANEWEEIEVFGKAKEQWLRKYLKLPYGIPTDDTYRIVIGNIDTASFYKMTIGMLMELMEKMLWLGEVNLSPPEPDILAVDGKESRGSKRKETEQPGVPALHTLNVYSTSYHMCIAQEFLAEKESEIRATPALLKLLDLQGTIVTADALNCQKDTAAVIVESGGDYVLAIKGNQKLFHKEVVEFFDAECQEAIKAKSGSYYKTIEKEHSGIVTREYYISENVNWFAELDLWVDLKTFGMVRKTHKKNNGETVTENRYYICSIAENAELFARAARGHWGVENNLHWSLDFTFKDDKNTSMAKTGAKNMQIMKKIVLAILEIVKTSYKMSMAKIRYKLSVNYEVEIEKLLSLLSIQSIEKALVKH